MSETYEILNRELLKAVIETAEMVGYSMVVALIFGTLLGLALYLTSSNLFFKNKIINAISGAIVNIIRSIPFVILMVLFIPLMKLITGTSIGPEAASVPLAIASIAFFARLVESSLNEVDKGVLEAAKATGAGTFLILKRVVFVEAFPSLVRAATVTFVSIVGYSAMAGLVGGGGIGNLAIQYGYYRYETGVMIVTVLILVVVVQVGQSLGDLLSRLVTRK
ncbi:MAG: ABC transporter permease [Clostridiales bacterium]|nr:ABC transporter permease [Clostridiales bacterium]